MQATILDRVTPQLALPATDGGQSVLTGYSTDISSAQDYYPFGMLMPGRYISDNTPQCITTQTTVLVPRIVRVYIRDLEPVPPVRTNGYTPVVVQTYPWTTPVRQVPLAATFAEQQPYFYNYLPASQHDEGFVARVVPGGGEYELDLSNEPTGLSLYLPFKTDTSAGGSNQVLGFGVGRVPPGVRLEARVRHYPDEDDDNYNEVLRWRDVREGEQVELRFGLPQGSAGKLMAELRLSAERGAPRFSSLAKVYIRNPWTETTEWIPETRLVTICEEKDKYRYGFNGMEKDNEVKGLANSLDFGARMLDTRVGRWMSLDPLASKYPSFSPYSFAANSPIIFMDPNGKEIVVATKEGQTQTLQILKKAFGKNAQDFSFDASNKLVFSGNPSAYPKAEREAIDGLIKVVKDARVTQIVYEQNDYTKARGGEATATVEANPSISENIIYIDPAEIVETRTETRYDKEYQDERGVPTTDEERAVKDEYGRVKQTGIRERTILVKDSKAARFFHGIGHVLFPNSNEQSKVIGYDNAARKIFKEEKRNGDFKKSAEPSRPIDAEHTDTK